MTKKDEIKKTIRAEFDTFTQNDMMDIATKYIMDLENPIFWEKEAKPYIGNAIALVMEFATTGLLIEGTTGNKIAKMSQETGKITIENRTI